jgi:molybdopterin-containing oxidoreductase family membrane subunit
MIAISVNVGMWLERFVIVVSICIATCPRTGEYYPTIWDWAAYAGSINLFIMFVLLFIHPSHISVSK